MFLHFVLELFLYIYYKFFKHQGKHMNKCLFLHLQQLQGSYDEVSLRRLQECADSSMGKDSTECGELMQKYKAVIAMVHVYVIRLKSRLKILCVYKINIK